jgi:hypothetical protein
LTLLQRIRQWLASLVIPAAGAAVLEELHVDPLFAGWARLQGCCSLAELWRRCPRADWLIEVAARAGVRRTLIGEAVDSCCESMQETARARGSQELLAVRQLCKGWVLEGGSAEPLCTALAIAVNLVCDADRDVQAARSAARVSVGRVFPEERIHAHLAELNALQLLAEAVRARLRYEELHAAVFDRPLGKTPYR